MTRRNFILQASAGLASLAIPSMLPTEPTARPVRIPEESEPHERTWMAYACSAQIWSTDLPGVRADQVRLANAISEFEPVVMLARRSDIGKLKSAVSSRVETIEASFDDLWIRDYGPQFLFDANGKLEAIDLRFNGWGGKQVHSNDKGVATFIARELNIPVRSSKVVMEGGAVEVNGKGTMVATKSCIANKNRNPGRSLAALEADIRSQFGLDQIVWLDGIAGKDITDGHTDFYARFLPGGAILANLDNDPDSFDYAVTRNHLNALRTSFGAKQVKTLSPPTKLPRGFESDDFAAGYINYYVVNGAVVLPHFGDRAADDKAREMLQSGYPGREIVPVKINFIASGGGGIHCSTLHQPRAKGE